MVNYYLLVPCSVCCEFEARKLGKGLLAQQKFREVNFFNLCDSRAPISRLNALEEDCIYHLLRFRFYHNVEGENDTLRSIRLYQHSPLLTVTAFSLL